VPAHVTILIANLPAEKDRRVIRQCLSLEAAGFCVTVIAPRGDASLKTLPGKQPRTLRTTIDRDVQEAASHADPRTTMRYDRARVSLDRHAIYIVATFIAGAAR